MTDRQENLVLVLPGLALLAVAFLLPISQMLMLAFQGPEGWTLDHFRRFLGDEFYRGTRLEQDPLLTVQGHVTYTFRPGIWVDAAAGYGGGAQSTVDGVEKDDRKKLAGWGLSAGYALTRDWGVKLGYVGFRRRSTNGNDADTVSVAISHIW